MSSCAGERVFNDASLCSARRSISVDSDSGNSSPSHSPSRRGSVIGRQGGSLVLYCFIFDIALIVFCSAFRKPGEDALLQLCRNSITADRLNLSNQNIGDEDFLFVTEFASAHQPCITGLHLDNNDLACPEVEKASFSSSLERLKLDGNRRLTPSAAVGTCTRMHARVARST